MHPHRAHTRTRMSKTNMGPALKHHRAVCLKHACSVRARSIHRLYDGLKPHAPSENKPANLSTSTKNGFVFANNTAHARNRRFAMRLTAACTGVRLSRFCNGLPPEAATNRTHKPFVFNKRWLRFCEARVGITKLLVRPIAAPEPASQDWAASPGRATIGKATIRLPYPVLYSLRSLRHDIRIHP